MSSLVQPSEITITSSGEEAPQVVVRDPQGVEIPAEVIPAGGNGYTVRYTPRCVGNHVVSLRPLLVKNNSRNYDH